LWQWNANQAGNAGMAVFVIPVSDELAEKWNAQFFRAEVYQYADLAGQKAAHLFCSYAKDFM
jgi:hypothetical protein